MKHLAHTLSVSIFMLICATPGFAQDVALRPAPKSKDKESVKIYRRYEESKNETITETSFMPIFGNTLGGLDMNVFYTYPGKTPTIPQSVNISFISSSVELKHRRDLTVKADGEVYQLGEMEYRRILNSNIGFTGKLSLSIPTETLNRIARAKKVHIKLGVEDFDLEARHLEKLRGLVSTATQ